MNEPRLMTRQEFLQAIARSRTAGELLLLAVVGVTGVLAVGLWQARAVVGVFALIALVIVVCHAASYLLSGERRRKRLIEESRRARTYWFYGYRGLMWSGAGVAMGNLFAFSSSGRDPTGGLVTGGMCFSAGLAANVAWEVRPPAA
jgi:hypothetical protein